MRINTNNGYNPLPVTWSSAVIPTITYLPVIFGNITIGRWLWCLSDRGPFVVVLQKHTINYGM